MKIIRKFIIVIVMLLIVGGIPKFASNAQTNIDLFIADLISQVGCTCECDLTLKDCQEKDPDCTTRPELMRQIKESIQEGKSNLMSILGCPCGCGFTLESCEREDPECTTRPKLIGKIKELAVKYRIEKEILRSMGQTMTPVERVIAESAIENKYLFLYFYKRGSRDSKKMSRVIEKAKKKWSAKANFVNIDVNDKTEKNIIDLYRVKKVSLTLVIAPNGAITSGFSGVVDLESLEKSFISPKMAEIIKAIQERKTIFLCLLNEKTKYSKEVLKTAQAAKDMLRGIAELVQVDPSDKQEKYLLSQLRVEPDIDSATTVVIAPTGIVADKFTGKITKRDLFNSFQKILAREQGCGEPTATGGSACQPEKGTTGESSCQ